MSGQNPLEVALKEIGYIAATKYGMQGIVEEFHDVNAFNYHAKEYYRCLVESYEAAARRAIEALKAEPVGSGASMIANQAGVVVHAFAQPVPELAGPRLVGRSA